MQSKWRRGGGMVKPKKSSVLPETALNMYQQKFLLDPQNVSAIFNLLSEFN